MKTSEIMAAANARRAGLIPYMRDAEGDMWVYVMIPSDPLYGGTSPQMAKGQIDPGYSTFETAVKEAEEELGLHTDNVGEIHYLGTFKKIAVYYTEVRDPELWSEPHYETGWAGWVNITQDFRRIRDVQREAFAQLQLLFLE